MVADRLVSAEHTLGTAGLYPFELPNKLSDSPETERCGSGAKPNTTFFLNLPKSAATWWTFLSFEPGTRLCRFCLQWGRKVFAMMREKQIQTTMPAPFRKETNARLYYRC
jgi:hypothetical protein